MHMIDVSVANFWLAVAGTAVLLWGLLLNRDATRAATRANELAAEQFALERRPWVQVTAKIIGPFPDGADAVYRKEMQFRVAYELKNVGMSPAFDVFFHGPHSSKPGDEFGLEFAEHLRRMKTEISPQTEIAEMRGGKPLFPGQTWVIDDYVASFGDVGEMRARRIPVLGAITYYRTKPDGEFHFTPATWRIVYPAITSDACFTHDLRMRDWSYAGLHPD